MSGEAPEERGAREIASHLFDDSASGPVSTCESTACSPEFSARHDKNVHKVSTIQVIVGTLWTLFI